MYYETLSNLNDSVIKLAVKITIVLHTKQSVRKNKLASGYKYLGVTGSAPPLWSLVVLIQVGAFSFIIDL